jgi:serine phosphatase RsbU (regulator of sigma subunit)
MSSVYSLIVEVPGEAARRLPMEKGALSIGRASANDLPLSDKMLSRRHVRIVKEGEGFTVEDLGSRNGTFVNGERLYSMRRLEPGDRISIGGCTLTLRRDSTTHVRIDAEGKAMPTDATIFQADSTLLRARPPQTDPGLPAGELARVIASLHLVQEMTMQLLKDVPTETMLQSLLDSLFATLHADRGAVMLKRGDQLEMAASRSSGRAGEEIRLSQTFVSAVLERNQAMLLVDSGDSGDLVTAQSIRMSGIKSVLAAPLENDGEVVGLIYLDSRLGQRTFSEEDLRLVTSVANVAAAKVQNARLAREAADKRRMEYDFGLARQIQQKLLPEDPPEVAGFDLFGANVPSREVSGDYYDFRVRPDGRMYAIVADVCGKGVGPALLMASLQATFAAWADESMPLRDLATRLSVTLATRTANGRFVTAVLLLLDPDSGRVEYVNAGHNPPLLVRASGETATLPAHGKPLALFPQPYDSSTIELAPGDLLFLYTDGITEAADRQEQEFGMDRLRRFMVDNRAEPAEAIEGALTRALADFVDDTPFADDRTWMLVRRAV